MKLYEINAEIERLYDSIEFDPETGEILGDTDEMQGQLSSLQMEKDEILSYLAKLVLNIRSDEAAIKEEEIRLKKRRERLKKKEDRLVAVLDRECMGQKKDLGVATVIYRKTSRVSVSDQSAAVAWLEKNGHWDALRVYAPEIAKPEVKKLINRGVTIPGCQVVEDVSCSLR